MHERRGRSAMPVMLFGMAARKRLAVAALAAALAAACDTGPSAAPTVAPDVTPTAGLGQPTASTATPAPPTPAGSAPAGVAEPCTAADLKASHGLVEGAAGSIITEVLLVPSVACSVDAFPVLGLRDANGTAIVGGTAAGPGRLDLAPLASYASAVRVANWCVPEPAFPLVLQLRIGDQELDVTGGSFPEEGNLPTCTADGAPILEGEAWTAVGP